VHLLPTARTLARKSRHGRLSEGQLVQLSNESIDSFSIAWQTLEPEDGLGLTKSLRLLRLWSEKKVEL
jgi:hypothetical protein